MHVMDSLFLFNSTSTELLVMMSQSETPPCGTQAHSDTWSMSLFPGQESQKCHKPFCLVQPNVPNVVTKEFFSKQPHFCFQTQLSGNNQMLPIQSPSTSRQSEQPGFCLSDAVGAERGAQSERRACAATVPEPEEDESASPDADEARSRARPVPGATPDAGGEILCFCGRVLKEENGKAIYFSSSGCMEGRKPKAQFTQILFFVCCLQCCVHEHSNW